MNNLKVKEKFTSLELVEQINHFRELEGSRKDLKHNDLLKVIRDEFEEEIGMGKISHTPYKHHQNGQMYPMFVLTASQAKQVLVRESKFVRRAIIKYIEKLEEQLKNPPQVQVLKCTKWKNERVMTMKDFAHFVGRAPSTLYWHIKQFGVSYYKLEGRELVCYKQENAPWVNAQINNLIVIPEREVIRVCRLMKLWTKTLEKALREYFGVKENVLPSQEVLQLESTQEDISLKTPENIQAVQKIKNKLTAIQCMLDELVGCRRKKEEHTMYGNFIREVSFAISIDVQNFNKQIAKM